MTDNSSPSTDRKACPYCGHMNRASAKVCTQCGRSLVQQEQQPVAKPPSKICPVCGHKNRLRAKVCSQCGTAFTEVLPLKTSIIGGRQKWCPQCGAKRRPGAKVCPQCGYRFNFTRLTMPVTQTPPPATVLPPDTRPPPPVKLPAGLDGEPAPYISSDELDRLRGGGVYHPNVFVRVLSRVSKKP